MKTRRVGIFHAGWPLQSHTTNLAGLIAARGYEVDLFLHRAPSFVNLETLRYLTTLHVHDLQPAASTVLKDRLKERFPRVSPGTASLRAGMRALRDVGSLSHVHRYLRGSDRGLLPDTLADDTLHVMQDRSYCCLIGVEKLGLLWAGTIAPRVHAPLMYYSLELYTNEFQRLERAWSVPFRRQRLAERRYHKKAMATIVQDPERARILLEDNGIPLPPATVFHVPVSVMGPAYSGTSRFLHRSLGLPTTQHIVLSFGQIHAGRYALDMTRAAQEFPDDWTLVMHGWGPPAVLDQVRSLDVRGKTRLSLELVPSHRIPDLVASADVGLSLYPSRTSNERLTAFASEKMAFYMQCGVPFVAFDHPGYEELAHEGAGRVITGVPQLRDAVQRILDDHDEYRQHARTAFHRHYDLAVNVEPLIAAIDRLSTG